MNGHIWWFWAKFSGCSHEVVDGEVPRFGRIEGDDSLVIKVHTFVPEFDCQECVGSLQKIDECLDSVDGATGYLDFEGLVVVVDQYFNVVNRDFGGKVK